jgi:carboxymethylenebutenolidase
MSGEVKERDVSISTADGTMDAHFAFPASGRHPGVVVWPDGLGLRPTFKAMGKRLAEAGYAVLTVNQFYRDAKAPPFGESTFADPAVMPRLMEFIKKFTPDARQKDISAILPWLDAQPEVDTQRKIGTTGYCMGGAFALRTAAASPRVGAVGSFHGGYLVMGNPDSPHLVIPQIKAQALLCVAKDDDTKEPAVKDTLRAAFAEAGLKAEIEVYNGNHGWCPPDMHSYDKGEAERAWSRLLATFKEAL